jgi:hydrogenase/urease accessory protein HupE
MNARGRLAAVALGLACALGAPPPAMAHESRPAYLQIDETAPGRYAVLWRIPVLSGAPLPVALQLPDFLADVRAPIVQRLSDSLVERRVVEARDDANLDGARIDFVGLQATITDVLVRIERLDGTRSTQRVRPDRPWAELTASQSTLAVFGAYVAHGVEHILFGFDHLLFVLALILLVPNLGTLVATITAFTVAHSITLALAVLDVVRVPAPPVEAAIALSILLLATEIARADARRPSLTSRWPWVVAFAFGLLHGFGFAGALRSVGLPEGDVPLALFGFNVGVELGQLAFVAAIVALRAALRRVAPSFSLQHGLARAATYGIGTLAAFWLFERIASFRG